MLTRCYVATALLFGAGLATEELTDTECFLSSRSAGYAILALVKSADVFDSFGEYRDMILMEDIDEAEREQVVQATICEELCGKGHKYCKSLKRELEDEAFEKMALFKGLLKTKGEMLKPAMKVARNMVKRMMEETEDLTEENIKEIDEKMKETIKENLSLDMIGNFVQSGLDKFGIPIDLKSALQNNPRGLFSMAKNVYNLVSEQVKKSKGGDSFDLSQILPKGIEMAKKFAKDEASSSSNIHHEPRVIDETEDFEEAGFEDEFFNQNDDDDIPAAGEMPKTEL